MLYRSKFASFLAVLFLITSVHHRPMRFTGAGWTDRQTGDQLAGVKAINNAPAIAVC